MKMIKIIGVSIMVLCGLPLFCQPVYSSTKTIQGPANVCYKRPYEYTINISADSLKWQVKYGKTYILGSDAHKDVVIQFMDTGLFVLQVIVYNNQQIDTFTKEIHTSIFFETIFGNTQPLSSSIEHYEALYKDAEYYEWMIRPVGAGSVFTGNGTDTIGVTWYNAYKNLNCKLLCKMSKCGYTKFFSLPVQLQKSIEYPLPNKTFFLVSNSRNNDTVFRKATIICNKNTYSIALEGDSIATQNIKYTCYIDKNIVYKGYYPHYLLKDILPGNYELKETIQFGDKKKVKTITKSVTLQLPPLPIASFNTIPASVCENMPVICKNMSQNYEHSLWDFMDGTTSTLTNVAKVYNHGPLTNIKLTVTNSIGCQSDATNIVKVIKEGVEGNIYLDSVLNTNNKEAKLTFTLTKGFPSEYVWMNGKDLVIAEKTGSVIVNKTGLYWIKIKDAYGCITVVPPISAVLFWPVINQ